MRVLICVVALCAACMAVPSRNMFDAELDDFWLTFKQMHNKNYENTEEYIRRATWEKNLRYIQRHNLEADLGQHKHRLGMNEYGDLNDEEYDTLLKGFAPSNRTKETPTFMAPANVNVPEKVDWREKGYVTPVKNQGHCGSCWAFSATGALEGQHFKRTGKLVSLSEQNIVDCAKKYGGHGCHGGSMDIAFEYIKMNHGVDTESAYPYTAKDGICKFEQANIGATDMGFTDVPHRDEDALKEAVATVGPVSVAIDASKKDFRFYKEGVYTSHECSKTHLDHGVLAVGYGTEMGEDYWIVKNSWGETWGKEGYIMMRRNMNMCGIADQASYPLV